MMKRIVVGGVGLVAAVVACASCASAPPRRPMQPYLSANGHEMAATQLDENARLTEGRYNENARLSGGMCRGRPVTQNAADDVCWTAMVNPTEVYLKKAAERRREAADHRAAAKTLRDAESSACAGISVDDRDQSPFDHYDDILRVEPLRGGVTPYLKDPGGEGVVVTFRAVPGMTVAWLQHVVDCQIARNAAFGNEVPSEPTCLLVPKGIRATVSAAADGFAVTVRAPDATTAQELFRRADLLSIPIRSRSPEGENPPLGPDSAQPTPPSPTTTPAPGPVPAPAPNSPK